MSYEGISVRDALEKLNAPINGWYLPQVQRQYVWGARHESEDYVCLLLDSLLKRYPIGGVVLWETAHNVPFREFVKDYEPGQFARQVDEGRWGANKALVYDGQQRLQTLYSVLYHRFNGRVLHFDLLFVAEKAESDETGFLFRDPNALAEPRYMRMTELLCKSCNAREKVALERGLLIAAQGDVDKEIQILENFSALWDIFVDTSTKSIAYFPVKANSPAAVNEVFRRLNTGGVALTQLELVLTKIKAVQSDYEEKLWELSEKIAGQSGGVTFESSEILQFFHLLVKGTIRIDEGRIAPEDVALFQQVLKDDVEPLIELFEGYLQGLFKINHASIVPRWLAMLPIASYLAFRKRGKHEWRIKALPANEIALIHRYFILSQFCDWNTQTMVNSFARLTKDAALAGEPFPLEEVRRVAVEKNRTDVLHYHQFLNLPWLATKILTPNRGYIFQGSKPQVDHIFPLNLEGANDTYRSIVDVLWNFQPMPAGINNYKRARHPVEFFNAGDGSKYWNDYDYLPQLGAAVWDDPARFVRYRYKQMRRALFSRYGLTLKRLKTT